MSFGDLMLLLLCFFVLAAVVDQGSPRLTAATPLDASSTAAIGPNEPDVQPTVPPTRTASRGTVLDREVYRARDYELLPTTDTGIHPATHTQIHATADDEIHFASDHGVYDELGRETTLAIPGEVDHEMNREAYPATHYEMHDEVHPEIDRTILEAVDRETAHRAYPTTPHEMHDEVPRDMRHEINLAIPGEIDPEMNREARPETAAGPHSRTLPEESPPPEVILAASDQTRTESQVETILREIFRPAGDRVEIQARPGAVTVRLRDTVTFRSGSADLLPEVRPLLDQVAQLLVARSEIRVETAGHTDEVPISTTVYPSNWELSAARAAAVARYLLDRSQIDPRRIEIAGYGEYQPVDTRPTLEGRARNRRVEIRFVHPLPDDSLT